MSVRVYLRRDAQRVARERQSWIRMARIQRIQGPADPALLAQVLDSKQRPQGWGLFSPDSDIRVRMLSWEAQELPSDWLQRRVNKAIAHRVALGLDASKDGAPTTGYREVNSEGDGLPGLVVDRYDQHRVIQITTAPMAARQAEIIGALDEAAPGATALVIRPERAAAREGFAPGFDGPELDEMQYREHSIHFRVPGPPTQKTGGYHDQRENRQRVAELAAEDGRPLLDLGSHVGGFSIHAAARGVDAIAVDSSAHMLRFVEINVALDAKALPGQVQVLKADMFGALEDPLIAGPFGTIVFDPPKIASKAQDRGRAGRATKRTLRICLRHLGAGGTLVVCSCSHHFGREEIDRSVREACRAESRSADLLEERGPGEDHPVQEGHAEGEYLRVNIYRVT